MTQRGKLSIGYVAKQREALGDGWVTLDSDVVIRRRGYVVATIGHLYMEKRTGQRVVWVAYSDTHLGRHETRTEALEAVKAYARLTLSRAIQEGVL